jgi:hypothetical protein
VPCWASCVGGTQPRARAFYFGLLNYDGTLVVIGIWMEGFEDAPSAGGGGTARRVAAAEATDPGAAPGGRPKGAGRGVGAGVRGAGEASARRAGEGGGDRGEGINHTKPPLFMELWGVAFGRHMCHTTSL